MVSSLTRNENPIGVLEVVCARSDKGNLVVTATHDSSFQYAWLNM
jgi:hypothetical protein